MNENATADRTAISPVVAVLGRDILQAMVYQIKTQPDHWLRLSEATQKEQISKLRDQVRGIVQNAVRIMVGGSEFKAVQIDLESVSFKDGIKGAFTMAKNAEGRHELADLCGRPLTIVMASPEQFLERMEEVKAATDQLDLFGGEYDPTSDQPRYRRDETEDRLSPARTNMMSWAELKEKLSQGLMTRQEAEEAYGGPVPEEEPKPAETSSQEVTQAPGVAAPTEHRGDPASPIERLNGKGEWEPTKLKKIQRGDVIRVIVNETEFKLCATTPSLKGPGGQYVVQLEEVKALPFGKVADLDAEMRSELLAKLNDLHVPIGAETLATFSAPQLEVCRTWADAYAADPENCKIARPHFLPMPDKGNNQTET